tara:strand:+ start:1616 stop:2371 length:756 start_codon:yes stop_codon:yes gene_type:complete
MKKVILFFILFLSIVQAREIGQTEITTEEGIEVYQKEKYYLLKKNVIINSDNFSLSADQVKAYFNKDLYDIINIYSKGNVILESNTDTKILGNEVEYDVIKEEIKINGIKSFLKNKEFTMSSDESIYLNNSNGKFEIYGPNSKLITEDIKITGKDIKGSFSDFNGNKEVNILDVEDEIQVSIITETSNMFAKKAKYSKQKNLIELFENVIINRNNESITGDYAKINTLDESYFVKTNESKRVKVILEKSDD